MSVEWVNNWGGCSIEVLPSLHLTFYKDLQFATIQWLFWGVEITWRDT